MKFESKFYYFLSRKCIWNVVCKSGGHFVQGKMSEHLEAGAKWLPFWRWHCQWVGTTLVQIMACCLFGTKPLSKPKYKTLHSWKCIWKHCLRHGGHFVQGEMSNFKPCLKQCWPSSLMYGSTGLSEYINVNFLPMRHSVKWNDKLNWNHMFFQEDIFF